jgi:Skp family chaperone for outer membrane proteins
VALAALALGMAVAVGAAAAPSPATNIAVVDLQAVQAQYQGAKVAIERFQTYAKKLYAPLNTMQTGLGLSDEEFAQYKKLVEQPVQDKDAIDKLAAKAKANVDEFQKLEDQSKNGAKLTDEQTARHDALKKMIYALYGQANEMNQQVEQTLGAEQQRFQELLNKLVDDAVAKVAKEQKFTLVVNRAIQSEKTTEKIILWNDASVDISRKVIDYLNANFKPEMLDAKN